MSVNNTLVFVSAVVIKELCIMLLGKQIPDSELPQAHVRGSSFPIF